jgi:hypothetical protein
MAGLGAGHVREIPLESGLEAGYAWLTQKNSEAGHVWPESLESG